MSLGLRDIWAGVTDLGIIGIWVVLEVMGLNYFGEKEGIDRGKTSVPTQASR